MLTKCKNLSMAFIIVVMCSIYHKTLEFLFFTIINLFQNISNGFVIFTDVYIYIYIYIYIYTYACIKF